MKITLNLILLLFTLQGFTQNIDLGLMSYKGLNFYSSKSEIINILGKPVGSYNPKYDCGFLSSEYQGKEFSTLDYEIIKFTGNENQGYLLEWVDLGSDKSISVKYGEHNLSCKTSLSELIEIFGKELSNHFEKNLNGSMVIFQTGGDDGIRIKLDNGKLIQIEYWSPC